MCVKALVQLWLWQLFKRSSEGQGLPFHCLFRLQSRFLGLMQAIDTMRALASKGEVIKLKQGDVLFQPGETGSTMFGLVEGAIRLTWCGKSGKEGHEDIPVGHVFGAGALVMEDHKRIGKATAICDSLVLEMNREKFLFALQETPMFAIQLLASVDERLRDLKMAD